MNWKDELKDLKDIRAGGQFHSNWLEIKCYGERPPLTLHCNTTCQMSGDCAQLGNLQVPVWVDSWAWACASASLRDQGLSGTSGNMNLAWVAGGKESPQASWGKMILEVVMGGKMIPLVWILFCFGEPNQTQIIGWGHAKYSDLGLNSAGHAHCSARLALRSTNRQKYWLLSEMHEI